MAYTKTNWTNTTPINTENLNNIENGIAELYDAIFPIGQIVIKGDDADYSNWLGFTWERTAVGKVLVGIDSTDTDFNTIGKTSGEKSVKLTVAQMPKHTHTLKTGARTADWKEPNYAISYQYQAASTANSSQGIETAGENQPHNNLQPYQVVAYWKRIA